MKELKDDYLIIQDNKFAKGIFKQNVLSQKIILSIISCIEEGDSDFKKYEFNYTQFSKDIKSKNQDVLKNIDNLLESSVRIFNEEQSKYEGYPIFSCIRYDVKSKVLTVQLNNLIMPFLLGLKKNFTQYQLHNITKLKSSYSLRIYNILRSDLYKGVVQYDLEKFKTMVNCNYKNTGDVKVKVLEVAKREINAKTDLEIDYEFVKTGRKVTALRFYMKEHRNLEQELYGGEE